MAVSREEYLKRYLSGPSKEKKKFKKKSSKTVIRKAGLKILDDDIDFNSLLPKNIQNSLDDDLADDNPVVIDLGLDDRPKQMKELERMRNSRLWKVVSQNKDESESLRQSELDEEIRQERESVKNSLERSNDSSDGRKNEKRRYDSESDASPARMVHDVTNQRISPTRNRSMANLKSAASSICTAQQERNSTRDDTSIEKRKRKTVTNSSDNFPPRQRQDSTDGSDNSPKRRRLDSTGSVDNSPSRDGYKNSPRRKRKDFADNVDDSFRQKRNCHSGSDNTSPQRKQDGDSGSDNSPPRRKQGRDPSSDNSPPRKKDKYSAGSRNNSPPRRRHNWSKHSDSSPRQRTGLRADSDSDMSPPRKENKFASHGIQHKQKADRTDQKEDATNSSQVIYRKDGKKRDLQVEKKLKEEEEAKKAALAAKYKEWNKGLKQKEMVQERIANALNEAEKPLARYRDDQDLDSHLRAQLHMEDPMLAFIKKKKSSAKGAEKPRYRGPQPPPNRFNIEPGYRWDGVDRSNGFEKKFFSKLSEDKARKDVAYKWSVEDM